MASSQQSQGTLTWLATVGPAIDALQLGQVLCVDELDASLHPTLTATLVDMFKDPDLNTRGAQIVFTTHDTALLDNSPVQLLEAGEVWMTEKSPFGASELFSLADFPSNRGHEQAAPLSRRCFWCYPSGRHLQPPPVPLNAGRGEVR